MFSAPTARVALDCLLDFHIAFTLSALPAMRAVEVQRAVDPAVSHAFERRSRGRRQLVRHVVTRRDAEGDLSDDWTVVEATDFIAALLSGGFTSELVDERQWTADQLRERLHRTIERALLNETHREEPS